MLDLPPLCAEKLSILSLRPDVSTKLTSKLLLGMFLCSLPEQMHAQLANYRADNPGQLTAAADAIWALYGSKFPTEAATEITVAAATTDGHCGCFTSPHRPSTNNSNNHGHSKCRLDGGNCCSSGAQTPGWKDSWREEWCWYHNKWAAKAQKCNQPCSYPTKGN